MLRAHVGPDDVDYRALKADRAKLDQAVANLNSPAARDEPTWPREQRLAFWINAYNVLTLRAIVYHYPIRSGWLTVAPRNSRCVRRDRVSTDLRVRRACEQDQGDGRAESYNRSHLT